MTEIRIILLKINNIITININDLIFRINEMLFDNGYTIEIVLHVTKIKKEIQL